MCNHFNIFLINRHIGNIGNGYEINGLVRRMITFESVFPWSNGCRERNIIDSNGVCLITIHFFRFGRSKGNVHKYDFRVVHR